MDIVVVERYNPVANHLANPMAHRSTGCMWRQMESYWWVKIVWRQIPMWRSALGSAVSLLVSDVSGEIQPGHPGDFSARLDEIGDLTGRNLGWDLMNRLSTLCSFFSSYFVNIPPKQHGQKILGPQPKIDPIFRHFSWTLVTLVGAMALAPSRATDAACAAASESRSCCWVVDSCCRKDSTWPRGDSVPGCHMGAVQRGGEAKSGENCLKNASEWLENSTWLMGTGDKSWKQLIKCDETAGTSKNIREIFRYDIMIWSENGGDHHYQKRLEVSSPCLAAPAGHCAPRFALHFVLPGRWVGRNNLNCYNERNLLQLPSGKLT